MIILNVKLRVYVISSIIFLEKSCLHRKKRFSRNPLILEYAHNKIVISHMSNIDVPSRSTPSDQFTQIILDFRGKNLPSEQIESDYNNTLNYPNNYFVAPESWRECFYTTSRKNMLLLSRGIENIVRVKPPFKRYTMLSLFQRVSNFNDVKDQDSVNRTTYKEDVFDRRKRTGCWD